MPTSLGISVLEMHSTIAMHPENTYILCSMDRIMDNMLELVSRGLTHKIKKQKSTFAENVKVLSFPMKQIDVGESIFGYLDDSSNRFVSIVKNRLRIYEMNRDKTWRLAFEDGPKVPQQNVFYSRYGREIESRSSLSDVYCRCFQSIDRNLQIITVVHTNEFYDTEDYGHSYREVSCIIALPP